MKTWLCGNSHLRALAIGFRQMDGQGRISFAPLGSGEFELAPFSTVEKGRVVLTQPDYRKNFEKSTGRYDFDPEQRWGFCMGTHTIRICRNKFWLSAEPSALCTADKQPVSRALLAEIVESDQRHTKAFLQSLKRAGVPVFVISCPPLRLDSWQIRHHRVDVVRHVDQAARTAFRTFLETEGIAFLEPPDEAVTDEGFLKPEFFAGKLADGRTDPHHANPEYGKRMMRRILSHIESVEGTAFAE